MVFHSKTVQWRRLGCHTSQENCSPFSLWSQGCWEQGSLESPSGEASVARGSQSCSDDVMVPCVLLPQVLTPSKHTLIPPSPTPTCLCDSQWSCTHRETSELTGRADPDYNALWILQARLKYLEGSVWLMGYIFDILAVKKVLGVVRRTNVSLYFTIWCGICFVRESRIWRSYAIFLCWVFCCCKCL